MDLNEIKALMDRFDTSACTVLELEEGNLRLRLEKGTAPVSAAPEIQAAPAAPGAAAPQPAPVGGGADPERPPGGHLLRRPRPGGGPLCQSGRPGAEGTDRLCAGSHEDDERGPRPVDCISEEVLVKDGVLVGFDAPMFRIREV